MGESKCTDLESRKTFGILLNFFIQFYRLFWSVSLRQYFFVFFLYLKQEKYLYHVSVVQIQGNRVKVMVSFWSLLKLFWKSLTYSMCTKSPSLTPGYIHYACFIHNVVSTLETSTGTVLKTMVQNMNTELCRINNYKHNWSLQADFLTEI